MPHTQDQLRIIWNHVKWLVEIQMQPSEENRRLLQKADREFMEAQSLQLKSLPSLQSGEVDKQT